MRPPVRDRRLVAPRLLTAALGIAAVAAFAPVGLAVRHARVPDGAGVTRHAPLATIALRGDVRDSMNAIWQRSNEHWNEVSEQNTLTQMLGTGGPTQREFLGCLRGYIGDDTLYISGWTAAKGMKQLQFAVTGSCDHVAQMVGTFHTHPYRADSLGGVLKEPGLSKQDLQTFTDGTDRAIVVVWDLDSLDAALRLPDGGVRHPVPIVIR